MLQFSVGGRRYTVRLNLPPAALQQVRLNVRRLVACHASGVQPDVVLQAWAESTTGRLRKRLADAGLVTPESDTSLESHLRERAASIVCGDAQRVRYLAMVEEMTRHWGAARHVPSLTTADGMAFAESLGPDGNQRRRKLLRCRRLLPQVFSGLNLTLTEMPDKKQFVSREVAERLLAACDDPLLRCVVALSRFAGLRVPSEPSRLQPADVDWESGRFRVHGKGGRQRLVPLFPEVRSPLLDVVLPLPIQGRSLGGMTLAARLRRLCRRVGVRMWRAPWHSMRASLESELLQRYPQHVVCCWMGHTAAVSLQHYARPLAEHWEMANGNSANSDSHGIRKAVSR